MPHSGAAELCSDEKPTGNATGDGDMGSWEDWKIEGVSRPEKHKNRQEGQQYEKIHQ